MWSCNTAKVQTTNTHHSYSNTTPYYPGCVSFLMEIHIQVFLVFRNKCFFPFSDKKKQTCWTRRMWWCKLCVHLYVKKKSTWTAKMMLYPNSAGIKSAYCSERSKIIGVFVDNSRVSPGERWHRRAYFNNNISKDHSVVLKMAGFAVWSLVYANLETKAQACCITKKCWGAFCMLIWIQAEYASLLWCDLSPHCQYFLGGNPNFFLSWKKRKKTEACFLVFFLIFFFQGACLGWDMML